VAITDRWKNLGSMGACEALVAITPNDSTDLGEVTRALYVGTAGDVKVMCLDSSQVTFTAVPAGTVLPVRIKRVMNTGTTAGSLIGMA
jgi:hypothetical protein